MTHQDGGRQGPIYDDDVGSSPATDNTMSLIPPLLQDEELLCPICNGHGHVMWDCQGDNQDGEKMVEHGIFPSTKEASNDDAITLDGASSEDAEHGMFPSAKEFN